MGRFGISLNLKRIAPAQIRNFDFNSMCVFNGKPMAAGDGGIFSLDDAEKDNGTNISAVAELATTDFGMLRAKRFRKMYVGYETSGNITVTVSADGGSETGYTLWAEKTGQVQHRGILDMSRNQKGVYWVIRIENTNGCDFSLDHMEGIINPLTKGRR